MKILDGKKISQEIKDELKQEVEKLKQQGVVPGLAVVLVGDNSASQIYVRNKEKACEYVGIKSFSHKFSEDFSEEEILQLIKKLNQDKSVNGILVQLPLPALFDEKKIIMAIDPRKDVDGFHPENVGKMLVKEDALLPCTPAGIMELLQRYEIDVQGKHCVVVGRSNIVGKPVAMLLLNAGATVTVCHSKTKDINDIIRQADILVSAAGKANLITGDMIKKGAVVIDVGINRLEDGSIVGDVDFEDCKDVAGAITPVPGGVGPMTIAMLMKNCVKATLSALSDD